MEKRKGRRPINLSSGTQSRSPCYSCGLLQPCYRCLCLWALAARNLARIYNKYNEEDDIRLNMSCTWRRGLHIHSTRFCHGGILFRSVDGPVGNCSSKLLRTYSRYTTWGSKYRIFYSKMWVFILVVFWQCALTLWHHCTLELSTLPW